MCVAFSGEINVQIDCMQSKGFEPIWKPFRNERNIGNWSACVYGFRFAWFEHRPEQQHQQRTQLWFHGNRFKLNHSHSGVHTEHGHRMRDCYIKIKCKTKKCSWNTKRKTPEQKIYEREIKNTHSTHATHIGRKKIIVWTIDCETVAFIYLHLHVTVSFHWYFIIFHFVFRIVSLTKRYKLWVDDIKRDKNCAHGIPNDKIETTRPIHGSGLTARRNIIDVVIFFPTI